jgi:hypothetical protein
MRGILSVAVQEIAKKKLNREITLSELRLLPYIQYVMMNEQKLEICKINQEERNILKIWKEEGHIEGGATGLSITKYFWDFLCEVLFIAYVEQAD